jgi:hypothetical protein
MKALVMKAIRAPSTAQEVPNTQPWCGTDAHPSAMPKGYSMGPNPD